MGPTPVQRSDVKRFAQKETCHRTHPIPESPNRPPDTLIVHKHETWSREQKERSLVGPPPACNVGLRALLDRTAERAVLRWSSVFSQNRGNLMHHYCPQYRSDGLAGLRLMIDGGMAVAASSLRPQLILEGWFGWKGVISSKVLRPQACLLRRNCRPTLTRPRIS